MWPPSKPACAALFAVVATCLSAMPPLPPGVVHKAASPRAASSPNNLNKPMATVVVVSAPHTNYCVLTFTNRLASWAGQTNRYPPFYLLTGTNARLPMTVVSNFPAGIAVVSNVYASTDTVRFFSFAYNTNGK